MELDEVKDACPNGLFHNPRKCVLENGIPADSSFLTEEWSVYFLPQDYAIIAPWIMQNWQNMDIIIHPNSGCLLEDHTIWTLWGGNVW